MDGKVPGFYKLHTKSFLFYYFSYHLIMGKDSLIRDIGALKRNLIQKFKHSATMSTLDWPDLMPDMHLSWQWHWHFHITHLEKSFNPFNKEWTHFSSHGISFITNYCLFHFLMNIFLWPEILLLKYICFLTKIWVYSDIQCVFLKKNLTSEVPTCMTDNPSIKVHVQNVYVSIKDTGLCYLSKRNWI